MAPIAEIVVPEENQGALMSVGSFAAYASVFWAYALNGKIIDKYSPIEAYQKIFLIGVIVATVGAILSLMLILNKSRKGVKDVKWF